MGWAINVLGPNIFPTTLLPFPTSSYYFSNFQHLLKAFNYVLDVTLLTCATNFNSLSSHSRDLLLYCKSWQWRHINLHTHLQKKTIPTLKRILWEKEWFSRASAEADKNDMSLVKPQKCPDFVGRIWPHDDIQIWGFTIVRSSLKKLLRARLLLWREAKDHSKYMGEAPSWSKPGRWGNPHESQLVMDLES